MTDQEREDTTAKQVVDLIPENLAWRILRKYASSTPGVGSQLSPTRGGTGRMDAACTVAQKLARCPVVERVLWAQEAETWLRCVWEPAIASPRLVEMSNVHREHPALVRAVFRFLGQPRLAERWARRAQCRLDFREQWCLLVCELSACWHHPEHGAAFREWIEGASPVVNSRGT